MRLTWAAKRADKSFSVSMIPMAVWLMVEQSANCLRLSGGSSMAYFYDDEVARVCSFRSVDVFNERDSITAVGMLRLGGVVWRNCKVATS